jgi:shikimate dehydrogenase
MNNRAEGFSPEQHELEPRRSSDLWFRENARASIEARAVRSTLRMGDRVFGTADKKGGYKRGDVITIFIQKENGELEPNEQIVPVEMVKKTFSEIDDKDFEGTVETKADLEKYYGEISPDQEFTLIKFEYMEEISSADKLVEAGVLDFAKQPANNPQAIEAEHYTIPLIEHDYPAKTPVMWNAAYAEFNISEQNIMLVGNPEHAKQILSVLSRDPKYKGGGAGVGFKDEAYKFLDELDPLAQAIGSVNFAAKTPEGKLRGYNTDGLGYAMSLERILAEEGKVLKDKKVLLLGAGGTANAVAFALAEKGAELLILNRTVGRAQELAARINTYFKKEIAQAEGEENVREHALASDVIVNVSTKGSSGALERYSAIAPAMLPATEVNIGANLKAAEAILQDLPKDKIISDIILGKNQTPLLKAASELGFQTLDGVPMVVNQGVEAFWILYGEELSKKGHTKEDVRKVMTKAAGN